MRGGQRLRCDSIIHEVLSFCIASLTLKRVASINQAPLGPTPQWDISSECPACGLEIGRDAASPKPDNYFCSLHDQIHQDTNDVPLRGLCFQTGFSSFLFCASHLNPTPEVFCSDFLPSLRTTTTWRARRPFWRPLRFHCYYATTHL